SLRMTFLPCLPSASTITSRLVIWPGITIRSEGAQIPLLAWMTQGYLFWARRDARADHFPRSRVIDVAGGKGQGACDHAAMGGWLCVFSFCRLTCWAPSYL